MSSVAAVRGPIMFQSSNDCGTLLGLAIIALECIFINIFRLILLTIYMKSFLALVAFEQNSLHKEENPKKSKSTQKWSINFRECNYNVHTNFWVLLHVAHLKHLVHFQSFSSCWPIIIFTLRKHEKCPLIVHSWQLTKRAFLVSAQIMQLPRFSFIWWAFSVSPQIVFRRRLLSMSADIGFTFNWNETFFPFSFTLDGFFAALWSSGVTKSFRFETDVPLRSSLTADCRESTCRGGLSSTIWDESKSIKAVDSDDECVTDGLHVVCVTARRRKNSNISSHLGRTICLFSR